MTFEEMKEYKQKLKEKEKKKGKQITLFEVEDGNNNEK